MNQLNIAFLIAASTILLSAVFSGYVKNRLWLSEPLLCLLVGVVISPFALDLISLDLSQNNQLTLLHQVARVTLAMSVMGAALRLPLAYEIKHWREIGVILSVGMLSMWITSTAVIYWAFSAPILTALLIGAIVTPTDPVLSDTIITGQTAENSIPQRMRNSLSMESGANDGLALLLVLLPVTLLNKPIEEALTHWLTYVLLWEVGAAIVLGLIAGWIAGHCWEWAHRQPFSEKGSLLTVGLSLTLAVLSGSTLINIDGILAVFTAGLVFNRFIERRETQLKDLQESIGRFFDLPIFILFGLVLPWQDWYALGWPALAGAVGVLVLRRLPVWFALRPWLPSLQSKKEVLFNGWFGPIGIAALFYATKSQHETDLDVVWTIASLIIFASILVHGITATPLSMFFGKSRSSDTA